MHLGALLLLRTGKWPEASVLGEPVRIEHHGRPEPEKEQPKEEESKTDPNVVAAFFQTN